MAGRSGDSPRFRYRDLFPWVHLFRAFRIARDVRKLLLAAAALLLLAFGNSAISSLAPDRHVAPDWPWTTATLSSKPDGQTIVIRHEDVVLFDLRQLLLPLDQVLAPAEFLLDGRDGVGVSVFAWIQLLWSLAVWSFFGAAITRLAAIDFARDDRSSLTSAVKFAGGRFLSYFCSPLLPIGFILAMWLLCFLGGLVGRVPWVGEGIVGALWFVPLALAFFMVLLLIGLAAGWPLMVATISTEATDAYDGFSRSFSYIFSRAWHALWYAIVALAYGLVVLAFVQLVAGFVIYLAGWVVASGMGLENLGPVPSLDTTALRFTRDSSGWIELGRPLMGFWLHALLLAVAAFGASYFWTAATIIYFLLRQSEDATDLDEVFLTAEPERDDLLPLVGTAASDQPVIERPPKPPAEGTGPGPGGSTGPPPPYTPT
jgi:hypothetical protein